MLKITAIVDDCASHHTGLRIEHGLSYFIEYNGRRFIFDFGDSGIALYNARKINLDFSGLDISVCSHAHHDHGGGFVDFAEAIRPKKLITGPRFFEPKYSFDGITYTYLGINFGPSFLEQRGISHQVCTDMLELDRGCYVIGNFNCPNALESIPERFVRLTDDGFVRDNFCDEVCMAFSTSEGLVVAVGCSHPGILNMLKSISGRLRQPIYAVLGGTHLLDTEKSVAEAIVSQMKEMGVKLLGLSHCSGETIRMILERDSDVASCYLATGAGIVI